MALRFLTAGESHGPTLIAILEGLPAGLPLDASVINHELARRQRGLGAGARMKLEQDQAQILGGFMAGMTTGAPLSLLIENRDHHHWRERNIPPLTIPRPGHADLTGALKYGYHDLRPALERASARETAARVAIGAVCRHLLAYFDIHIGGYVTAIGEVSACFEHIPVEKRAILSDESDVRCPDPKASAVMQALIQHTAGKNDTLGGVIEVAAWGLPPGLGSYVHWDRRLDARLGAAALSVPAIKGVEIGPAFENARLTGTQVQDPFRLKDGTLVRPTNRAGGLEGGITNGEPVVIRAAMKPIATTLTPQQTVDLARGIEAATQYERSDICPVPRAVPVLEAVIAFVLADALLEKLGGDSIEEMHPRFNMLRRLQLSDLPMDNEDQIWWRE